MTLSTTSVFSQAPPIVEVERVNPEVDDVTGFVSVYAFNEADECFVPDADEGVDIVSLPGLLCENTLGPVNISKGIAQQFDSSANALLANNVIDTDIAVSGIVGVEMDPFAGNDFAEAENRSSYNVDATYRVGDREIGGKDDGVYTRKITIVMTGQAPFAIDGVNYIGRVSATVRPRDGQGGPTHSVSAVYNPRTRSWDLSGQYTPGQEDFPCITLAEEDVGNDQGDGLLFTKVLVFEDVVKEGEEFEVILSQHEENWIAPQDSVLLGGSSSMAVSCDIVITDQFTIFPGDVNDDCNVDFADISEFVAVLVSGVYDPAADLNCDGEVTFADIPLFVDILLNS